MSAPPALSVRTTLLLLVPPLLWAGNAITGRLVHELIPPMTFNFLRWSLALLLLLPIAHSVLARRSPLWSHWKRYAVLGLLGVGLYNSLQYLALQTSTPLNVTLVASSSPIFMLVIGAVFFQQRIAARQITGSLLSIAGVLMVMSRGDSEALMNVRLVPGDVFVLLATFAWAWYSWMLTQTHLDPAPVRQHWARFLVAQIVFGLCWSGAFSAAEWTLISDTHIVWGWPVGLALLYVAIGPSALAYRCWGLGVQAVGPTVASFFANFTPVFAASLSVLMLGDPPQLYHLGAFVLIGGGILVSSKKRKANPSAT